MAFLSVPVRFGARFLKSDARTLAPRAKPRLRARVRTSPGYSPRARFTKAMSLSFWPPVFGKQGEAIQHFEILANQQEEGPPSGHFAQTYLLLGNMYAEQGKSEKALEAWERGLGYFPSNESLNKQLKIHQGGL